MSSLSETRSKRKSHNVFWVVLFNFLFGFRSDYSFCKEVLICKKFCFRSSMINMKQARKTTGIPLYQHMKTLSLFFLFISLHFHKTLFHKDIGDDTY